MGKTYRTPIKRKNPSGLESQIQRKFWKKYHNRQLRRYKEPIVKGGHYKKVTCSWMLEDCKHSGYISKKDFDIETYHIYYTYGMIGSSFRYNGVKIDKSVSFEDFKKIREYEWKVKVTK